MKTTVIYHSADYDGIFCREIARRFLPDAELVGWNHGDPKIPMPAEGDVYVLDLAPDCLELPQLGDLTLEAQRVLALSACERVFWIDHHKTSIEKWPQGITGYRIDGVAACRLAWQWFAGAEETLQDARFLGWPDKQHFVDREVREPLAVRLAGEYDIWDKRDSRAETFQYGLRVCEGTPNLFEDLLQDGANAENAALFVFGQGLIAQSYARKVDADLVTHRSYRLNWEGLNFIVLNTGRFNSLTFAALDVPETGHDALLGYMFDGKQWKVSLYHAKHRTELDLSAIAVRHGGGGHRGACGFACKTLPFGGSDSR